MLERGKRLLAYVVLDSLGVGMGGRLTHSDGQQESHNDLMPPPDVSRPWKDPLRGEGAELSRI